MTCDLRKASAPEEIPTLCPYCQAALTLYWQNGICRHHSYVMIADWAYHTNCWEEQVRRFPPYG